MQGQEHFEADIMAVLDRYGINLAALVYRHGEELKTGVVAFGPWDDAAAATVQAILDAKAREARAKILEAGTTLG